MFKIGDIVRFKDNKKIIYFVRDFYDKYILVTNIDFKDCKNEELLFTHSVYTDYNSLVYATGSHQQLHLF